MRKMVLLAVMVALAAMMLAAGPAAAQDRDFDGDIDLDDCVSTGDELFCDVDDFDFVFDFDDCVLLGGRLFCEVDGFDFDEEDFILDRDGLFFIGDPFDFFDIDDDFDFVFDDGVGLGVELGDVESGDIEQSTSISQSGDNSNQAAPVLNAANTGNVQNVQGVLQFDSEADDIEFEGGGSIEVSPEMSFSADQSVQQAAVAR